MLVRAYTYIRMHGAAGLRAHLCHRELAAPFHYGQALGHRLPGLGRAPELRQIGIATLHVARVDASEGAEQLQREIL